MLRKYDTHDNDDKIHLNRCSIEATGFIPGLSQNLIKKNDNQCNPAIPPT